MNRVNYISHDGSRWDDDELLDVLETFDIPWMAQVRPTWATCPWEQDTDQ